MRGYTASCPLFPTVYWATLFIYQKEIYSVCSCYTRSISDVYLSYSGSTGAITFEPVFLWRSGEACRQGFCFRLKAPTWSSFLRTVDMSFWRTFTSEDAEITTWGCLRSPLIVCLRLTKIKAKNVHKISRQIECHANCRNLSIHWVKADIGQKLMRLWSVLTHECISCEWLCW